MPAPLRIGLLIFPKVTQLDLTGPLQVFSSVPGAIVHLIWKRIEPVPSDSVLTLTPTVSFADCPQLDVICVPGGAGTDDMVNDEEMLAFLRKQAEGAKYVTSVCTGSLVLGAAGLLKGKRATCHWAAIDHLKLLGAIPVLGVGLSQTYESFLLFRLGIGAIGASFVRGRALGAMPPLKWTKRSPRSLSSAWARGTIKTNSAAEISITAVFLPRPIPN